MAKRLSGNPATNAANLHQQTRSSYFVETDEGLEERLDRKPMGRIERFVDKEGNVVSLQMFAEGDQRRAETEQRQRRNAHTKGFVEFAQCPLINGARQFATRDFSRMPSSMEQPCKHQPRIFEKQGRDVYAKDPCPHVQWLITHRREQAAKAFAVRNAHVAAAERAKAKDLELKELQADLIKEQIAERQAKKAKPTATKASE